MIKNVSLERWLSMESFKDEIWKDIDGFDGVYEISNYGRVKSSNYGGMIRKPRIQNNGYETVRLWKCGKPKFYLIHRLVFSHFIGYLNDDLVVDHIDGNKVNNHVSNLQQIESRDNTIKAVCNKYMRGVKKVNRGYYSASMNIKYKRYYLGSFKTIEEANEAYNKAVSDYKKRGILPQINSRPINRVINGYKICRECGENKPVSEYQACSGMLQSICKDCAHKRQASKRALERGDKPLYMHRKTWERIKNTQINNEV